ncbi:prephenate dehydratase [Canibacter sp. lx-45]|uniref:prephenate dehydratase n=1 Tax=Canibacter zhuwentaonis TaxID=2837491 RepID=UPI001BDD6A2D|nr:prephenate dehydratase [Canibacter zhuwentaonis]
MSELRSYSYLGPAGTFTEAALGQVPAAQGQEWLPVANVTRALLNVSEHISDAAMIAIENSIDGGVSAAQDALAQISGLQILGEYLVPVRFALVTRPGAELSRVQTVAAHPVAYAQCRAWLESNLPGHRLIPATSNAQAAADLLASSAQIDAAIAPPNITSRFEVRVHNNNVGSNPDAQTRFCLVGRKQPVGAITGRDKTSLIVTLPEDRSGSLLTLLEQFAARGVNLTQIASRPTGEQMGNYRFFIDTEGHIREERVRHALIGLKMHSPEVVFLGSYPRADNMRVKSDPKYSDSAFCEASAWVEGLL